MRTAGRSSEVLLQSYERFSSRDPLTDLVFERMLAGVSMRRYERTNEPIGSEVKAEGHSDSRSAVSRELVARTRTALGELMSRRLDDVRLAVMMLDALEISGRTHVVALGIATAGDKLPVELWEGSTENAAVAQALLSDLVDRGLDPGQGVLFMIDGAKALRKAIGEASGSGAPVHRCIRHEERNVTDHLDEATTEIVRGRLHRSGLWRITARAGAPQGPRTCAGRNHPSAASRCSGLGHRSGCGARSPRPTRSSR